MSPRPDRTARSRRRGFGEREGFTLVEVLVAFTVMAVLLSVLFRGVVGIRAGAVAFDDHTHVEIVARSVLDDALADRTLKGGTYSGEREGYQWVLTAEAIDLSAQMPPPHETSEPKKAEGQAALQQPGAQPNPSAPTAENAVGAKEDSKPVWAPQRLRVRVATKGRPVEIETIRLVKAG